MTNQCSHVKFVKSRPPVLLSKHEIAAGILLLILTIGYFVYPIIQQRQFNIRAQHTIIAFESRIEAYRADHQHQLLHHIQSDALSSHAPYFWLDVVGSWLSSINMRLYLSGQEHLVDPFDYIHPSFNLESFGFYTDIVGVLAIPVIDINLPIYLGASVQHMNNGVAHVTHSSFPIGGDSTNTVIAGHRNMAITYGQVFSDIGQLQVGDKITITSFIQCMTYTVVEKRVVHANDADVLRIQSGRELVTLITTYGRRGNRRYLVIAERVYN